MRNPVIRGLLGLVVPLALVAPAPAAAQAEAGQSGFWRQLGDSTLDRLMAEALRANQDVAAAMARIRGARAARQQAVLDLVPTVTAGGGFTRQRLAAVTVPGATGRLPDQSIWDVGIDAGWEVDLFGRLRHGLRGEGALVGAAEEDVRGLRVTVLAEVAQAYFDLRGAQERLLVARRNAENQGRTLELTRQRLDAGRGTAFDTERAQAQLSFTEASIPLLEAAVAAAGHRIGVLVGRGPVAVARELVAPAPLPALPDSLAGPGEDSLVRGRPDVAAAERRLAAERSFLRAAKADYLPRVSVGGTAGLASGSVGGLGDRGSFRYGVGPSVSWPLLNLGRVKASVQAATARRDEVGARLAQTLLLAREELETATVRYRTARARVVRIEEAAASSGRAAELARIRFGEGVSDFLQVLDAERTQLDAESELARSRADAAAALAALYRARGGDGPSWSP